MPIRKKSLRHSGARAHSVYRLSRSREPRARRKLGTSHHLIAPAHTLTLPSLEGVKSSFESSHGFEAALPPARVLVRKGLLSQNHLTGSGSAVAALDKAFSDIVGNASASGGKDAFDVEIHLIDRLEDREQSDGCLFFVWGNAAEPRYMPLRPVFEQLAGNPFQERLMASLYYWLYRTSCRVFFGFGFDDAQSLYDWRKQMYMQAREEGEDVDLEGEVEFADPSTVVNYIRNSKKLRLKKSELGEALSSIEQPQLKDAFTKAHRMFVFSRAIRLPDMTAECEEILHHSAYHMEGDPMPGVGISHWRDDAIVAWLDEYYSDQFNSGVNCRPPIMTCFRADDSKRFSQIVSALPKMVHTALALSEWFRIAERMEHATHY
jgi:hypothetical protein